MITARDRLLASFALIALAIAAIAANAAAPVGPLRTTVSVVAALLVPGGAITVHMKVADRAHAVALALGLSVAVETLLALAMVWTRWWHPGAVAAVVLAISVLALGRRLLAQRRGNPSLPIWHSA